MKRCADGTMHIFLNGEDLGVAASNIPKVSVDHCLWVMVDLL